MAACFPLMEVLRTKQTQNKAEGMLHPLSEKEDALLKALDSGHWQAIALQDFDHHHPEEQPLEIVDMIEGQREDLHRTWRNLLDKCAAHAASLPK